MREMETTAVVLLLLSVGAWSRGEEKITKVTGSIVTFRASAEVQPSEISWLKNEIKIVELEEGKEPDFYPFYNIRDRVDVNLTEKSFILQDVTPVDSGTYKAVLLVNGRLINFFFILLVLDPVCKVSVQNTTVGHNVSLNCSCSSDVAQPSQYEWRNVTHRVSDQQDLTVSMGKEPQTLWCVVRNEVSSSNATVTVPSQVPDERSHIIIIAAVLVTLIVFSIIIRLKPNDKYGGLLGLCHSDRQQVANKDSEDPECEEDVKKPGNGAVQMATRTSTSPTESKPRTAMGREDEHGAQDSAQKEEVPKFQNSVHVEGAQDSAQKEEVPKFQNSVHVEGAQDSAQKEEETKFQNSVHVEGAQDSAQKEEETKFQNSVHVEEAQDSTEIEDEDNTKM